MNWVDLVGAGPPGFEPISFFVYLRSFGVHFGRRSYLQMIIYVYAV